MDLTNSSYNLNETQTGLLSAKTPMIDISGEVNGAMFGYVRTAIMLLRAKGSPAVDVFITSPGGGVDPGLDIYDLLRLYPGTKTALVHNQAASMGALILQACDVRQCAVHSSILIHHISRNQVSLDTLESEKKTTEMRDDMRKSQQRLYAILAERSGKKVSEIKRACAKDEYMDAQEALDFGLIDEIV